MHIVVYVSPCNIHMAPRPTLPLRGRTFKTMLWSVTLNTFACSKNFDTQN